MQHVRLRPARAFSLAVMVLVTGLAGLLLTTPARAELTICNESGKKLSIAIGYKSGDDWTSEGWWNIEQGDCKPVISGDLTNRHYYYADFNGRITGENYFFCTTQDSFTIVGDENCDGQGYDKTEFAHLDTGTKAKSFTLTITAPAAAVAEPSPPLDAVDPVTGLPPVGTYGEPFTAVGWFTGCDRVDGLLTCQFDVDGWTYVAYDDNRNLMSTLEFFEGLAPNTEISMSGDMVSYGDVSADVVIREFEVLTPATHASSGPTDIATVEQMLQGYWQSLDDPNAMIAFFAPSDMEDYYEEELLGTSDYFLSYSCPDDAPTGTVHLISTDRTYSETSCYEILTLREGLLELMYLPRGNILSYGPAHL